MLSASYSHHLADIHRIGFRSDRNSDEAPMSQQSPIRTPQQALAALLDQQQPQHLLSVGASQLPAIEAYLQAHPQVTVAQAPAGTLSAELASRRYDAR